MRKTGESKTNGNMLGFMHHGFCKFNFYTQSNSSVFGYSYK